jgi:hypothetical protein
VVRSTDAISSQPVALSMAAAPMMVIKAIS